ncbi:unnamed protein product [Prorocentrum cordatum]|uniref:Uncharacterized protein n=1 Tax=Prorocentrum cordatum TaxID=2364126 RepID=A0ABN9SCH1_9DINO|nr:unnamed protein product [Polarella glacialis]
MFSVPSSVVQTHPAPAFDGLGPRTQRNNLILSVAQVRRGYAILVRVGLRGAAQNENVRSSASESPLSDSLDYRRKVGNDLGNSAPERIRELLGHLPLPHEREVARLPSLPRRAGRGLVVPHQDHLRLPPREGRGVRAPRGLRGLRHQGPGRLGRGVLPREPDPGEPLLLSWEARRGSGVLDGDFIIHSRYCQHLEPLSLFFVLVGIAAGVGFIALLIRGDYYWDRFWEKNAEVPAEDLLRDREGRHREHEAERPEASTSGDEGSSSSGGAAC